MDSGTRVGGNKRVDRLAKSTVLGESFLQVSPRTSDFFPLAKARILTEWQVKWNRSDMGPFTFFPNVSRKPWFSDFKAERHITKINWMFSNHTCLRSHLTRIRILETRMCECEEDYETLEHILWACSRLREERRQMI
jgi:hypothetical protein